MIRFDAADLRRIHDEAGSTFTRSDWMRVIGKRNKSLRGALAAGLIERTGRGTYRFSPQATQGDHTAALGVAAE